MEPKIGTDVSEILANFIAVHHYRHTHEKALLSRLSSEPGYYVGHHLHE